MKRNLEISFQNGPEHETSLTLEECLTENKRINFHRYIKSTLNL